MGNHYDELGYRRWLATRTAPQLSDTTVTCYGSYVRRFADHALDHGDDPHGPDPLTVRDWSRRLPASTSSRDMARAALVHLCDWRGLDRSIADAVERVRPPRRPKWRSLRPSVAAEVLRAADGAGEVGTGIYLGLYTGMRVSEVVACRWDRVDLERNLITFWRQKVRDELTLPIHPQLAARLAPRVDPSGGWLFPGRCGGHVHPGTMSDRLRKLLDPLGLEQHVTMHTLRHTAGTWLYEATGDLLLCQQFLGHARPETTSRYVRVNGRRLASGIAAIDYSGNLPAPDHRPQWAA